MEPPFKHSGSAPGVLHSLAIYYSGKKENPLGGMRKLTQYLCEDKGKVVLGASV